MTQPEVTLVTGGCGYIGSHFCLRMRDEGHPVVIIDNLSTGFRESLPAGATLIVGDVGDRALLDEVFRTHRVGAVVHFAARLSVPESVQDPMGYYHNNTVGTLNLLGAMVRHGVRKLIFSSTAATYGAISDAPIPEDAAQQPANPYGASKMMSERQITDVGVAHGLQSIILRYFNVAGADPKGRLGQRSKAATHLIKIAAEVAVKKRSEIVIFGTDYPTPDRTCIRDYVHVMDLVDAHILALDAVGRHGQTAVYNCGYGHGASVLEVVSAMEKMAGASFRKQNSQRRAGDVPSLVANADKIKRELGWRPKYDDLGRICDHALAWERTLA